MKRPLLLVGTFLVVACGSATSVPDATAPGSDAALATAGADAAPGGDVQSADTWGNFGTQFVDTYCVRCHAPGGSGYRMGQLDFRSYDVVKANAAEIRCGTAATLLPGCSGFPPPKQFPIADPRPTDAERDRFVAWIEAGAPI